MFIKIKVILFTIFVSFLKVEAQFAPPVGQPGTTAIHMSDVRFTHWATACTVERGWQDIADTTIGKVTQGIVNDALGMPDPFVISLGDGGKATLSFTPSIQNKEGVDFAVFENSFSDDFLELAFVEVSTDGISFVRFPSISLTNQMTQIGTFGVIDTRKIHNLAGKYKAKYGTPFDLNELKDSLKIDINDINFIRVIDVGGSIDSNYATFDSQGNTINDPYPTAFPTGGFDLDAIGVIDESIATSVENNIFFERIISPIAIPRGGKIDCFVPIIIYNTVGSIVGKYEIGSYCVELKKGIYMVKSENSYQKIIIY